MATSGSNADTKSRLSSCWEFDIEWHLFPDKVIEVRVILVVIRNFNLFDFFL